MITRRNWLVYGVLIAVWVMLLAWQVAEHIRVQRDGRAVLTNRAKDISNTLGVVLRSEGRFFGVITKEQLESAMNALIKHGDVDGIAVLNEADEVVAEAGAPVDVQLKGLSAGEEYWGDGNVVIMNLVDLGTNMSQAVDNTNITVILPQTQQRQIFSRTNRPPPQTTNQIGTNVSRGRERGERSARWGTNGPPSYFRKPSWMKDADYKALIEKQGVHSFALVLSTDPISAFAASDLWMRLTVAFFATVALAGLVLAWRNVAKTSELQIRLVRASELNSHLKEMNLAAAGLAHETRNPLNIIRGLAQLICKQDDVSPEITKKTRDIINEADRLTAQLNEFINYSRPREVRRTAVDVQSVASEVVRALNYDIEEKKITLQIPTDPLKIQADEQLLRQALFNLVLNAVQATDTGGTIELRCGKVTPTDAFIEIRDNGHGVAPEHRNEIFKPYFTTNEKGTGLGLAVVQQIILAHGWEIACVPNEPKGAIFRIDHVKLAAA
jgi:signal transduction histidine kinase